MDGRRRVLRTVNGKAPAFHQRSVVQKSPSLFRILNYNYDRENPTKYYDKTLKYLISGVIFSFSGGLIKMLHTLVLSH